MSTVVWAACSAPESWELTSNDGNIRFRLQHQDGSLSYLVYYDDTMLIVESPLGIMMDSNSYGDNVRFAASSLITKVDHDAGDANQAYQEQTYSFLTTQGELFDVIVRIYNDAVTFRYGFPWKESQMRHIHSESTDFNLPVHAEESSQPFLYEINDYWLLLDGTLSGDTYVPELPWYTPWHSIYIAEDSSYFARDDYKKVLP
ncbi:MAG: glycoside hydrolase family 97 N-terminal domain-containing protein [Mediterranea sp.]|nr:glycoside hydrolase family 97 N-terminal domain-containing protein [Mediterranea sp.]